MHLSAYNAAHEPGRLERLCRVWLAVISSGVKTRIDALHDHKGELSVRWASTPSAAEIETVVKAWEDECEYESNHYVGRELIFGDHCGVSPWD
jgi:hypothetical protein